MKIKLTKTLKGGLFVELETEQENVSELEAIIDLLNRYESIDEKPTYKTYTPKDNGQATKYQAKQDLNKETNDTDNQASDKMYQYATKVLGLKVQRDIHWKVLAAKIAERRKELGQID